MDKLLNLLSEFYGENRKFSNDNGLLIMTNGVENLSGAYAQTYIISLQGGFIKWLVDNVKINRDKVIRKSDFRPIVKNKFGDLLNPTDERELLMLLSISDTPIEDLISYLR